MKKIFIAVAIILCTHLTMAQSNPSIDKRATHLTDWLTDVLDLESQQKTKVFTVYQRYLNDVFNTLEMYRDNITELRNQKDALEAEQQQSISAILNEVQFEKYARIISKRAG